MTSLPIMESTAPARMCATCTYFVRDPYRHTPDSQEGECFLRPPVLVGGSMSYMLSARRPTVYAKEFCKEWEAK